MLNIELLRDAVEWVEWQDTLDTEKREWRQDVWFVDLDQVRDDVTPEKVNLNTYSRRLLHRQIAESHTSCGTAYCVAGYIVQKEKGLDYMTKQFSVDNFIGATPVIAAALLGVKLDDVIELFHEHNSVADVREFAEELAGKYGMSL